MVVMVSCLWWGPPASHISPDRFVPCASDHVRALTEASTECFAPHVRAALFSNWGCRARKPQAVACRQLNRWRYDAPPCSESSRELLMHHQSPPLLPMPPSRLSNVDSFALPPAATKMAPMHAIHIVGRCLRLVSVYAAYHYVIAGGVSLTFFVFVCLLGSAAVFSALQRPWRGRPLPNSLLGPALLNGGVMAFSLLLWANGLRNCGPVRTILGEYAGAVLGALSTLLLSRNGLVWRRIGGLLAMCAAYYFLSQGWAMSSYSPFSFGSTNMREVLVEEEEGLIKSSSMLLPAFSGILAAIRRIISRRVSTKNYAKKRLHAVTVAAAACFIFPFAMYKLAVGKQHPSIEPHGSGAWAYTSTILFGVVLIFYVDTFVEDRLHIVVASPTHILVTGVGIILFEYIYRMDFSFLGFIVCATILGLGIYEATATDSNTRDLDQENNFLKEGRSPVNMSILPS